ncbi:DUF4296 domain-containing protein [Flavobacterium sp. UBA6135]|uniref:DUF4296 domain-containing protein n=1 Tax=Flavobacterium sp. UBA6135 TaxID=1946553 RepID=UPI0025C629CD|nr:DUF4296 domain-containing protein [Flavobacterium sp. UBA6135]
MSLIVCVLFLSSCKDEIERPEKLFSKEQMVDMIYDLTILEAIKNNNPSFLEDKNIDPYTYIYVKYDIDSLEFVQNNKYYASDVKEYGKIYEKVLSRIEQNKSEVDTLLKKESKKSALQPISRDSILNIKKKVLKKLDGE